MNRVIFRGKVKGKPSRRVLMQMYFNHPMCDLGDVSKHTDDPQEWQTAKMTLKEHLDFKFILSMEGNDVASNLKWVMSSNSIAVMPRPTCETWFMEGTLIPNYHYIEIKDDLSDLEERLNQYIRGEKKKAIEKVATEEELPVEVLDRYLAEYDFSLKEQTEIIQDALKEKHLGLVKRRRTLNRIIDRLRNIIRTFSWD